MGIGRQIVDASKAGLSSLENRLANVLKPIPPRKEFVSSLGHRIQSVHRPSIIERVNNLHVALIVVAAWLTVGVLIMVGLRTIMSLFKNKRRPITPSAV